LAFPFGPRFVACYEKEFAADRAELGLAGENFDFFFTQVEAQILDYPWINSATVPESGGTLMRETRALAPDLPALYVYYKVNVQAERIRFLGLSRAWSREELPPS
jgi:hypothetical protein